MKEDPAIYIKPELKIDQWLPIEYFQYIPNGVTAIHCDTRDFHMVMSTDVIEGTECIDGCHNFSITTWIDEQFIEEDNIEKPNEL